jgi:hypothetical protein
VLGATTTDSDSSSTLQLCIEVQSVGTSFTNTATACSSLQSVTGSASASVSRILSDGNYHWQARTVDSAGYGSSWVAFGAGSAADFVLDTVAPSTPGTPSTETPTLSQKPTWVWDASTDSLSGLANPAYVVQWSEDESFATVLGSGTSNETSFIHTDALEYGVYYLRVAAVDMAGNTSAWSDGFRVAVVELPPVKDPGTGTPTSNPGTTPSSNPTSSPGSTPTTPQSEKVPLLFITKSGALHVNSFSSFTTTPFLQSYLSIAEAFPTFAKTLREIGITRPSQLGRLKTEPLTLQTPPKLSMLPTNIVFAQNSGTSGLTAQLSVDSNNQPYLTLPSLIGREVTFYIKPDKAVSRVEGDLLLPRTNLPEGATATVATLQFTDPDGDGVYTAMLNSPKVAGTYAMRARLTYTDTKLANKDVQTVTVIDPEGYIYEAQGDKEVRLPNAKASLYVLNPSTKSYELWDAEPYGQVNPQVTKSDGQYAFLVPAGTYQLRIEVEGYKAYQSEPLIVVSGEGIHLNVAMQRGGTALYALIAGLSALIVAAWLLVRQSVRIKARLLLQQ